MRHVKYILFLFLLLLGFLSCETYGDYEIEYSSIHPLSGRYRVNIVDETGALVISTYGDIANTSDESTTQCWLRIGAYNTSATLAYSINGKINCDLNTLTFSGANIENLAGNVIISTETFSVTNGNLTLNGVTTQSGTVTDAISFTFTNSRFPGKTYSVEGYRYTGWNED